MHVTWIFNFTCCHVSIKDKIIVFSNFYFIWRLEYEFYCYLWLRGGLQNCWEIPRKTTWVLASLFLLFLVKTVVFCDFCYVLSSALFYYCFLRKVNYSSHVQTLNTNIDINILFSFREWLKMLLIICLKLQNIDFFSSL